MAGSEESGSCSSSQSSIDLEDEENHDERSLRVKTSEESHLKTIEGYLSRHLRDVSSSEADADCEVGKAKTGENVNITNQVAPIHRSECIKSGAPITHFKNPLSTEETIKSYCTGKAAIMNYTKEPESQSSLIKCNFEQQDDTVNHAEDTVNNETPITKSNVACTTEAEMGIQHGIAINLNHDRYVAIASSEWNYKNELQGVEQAETTMKSSSNEEGAAANESNADRPDRGSVEELNNSAGVVKYQLFTPTVNSNLSEVEPEKGEKVITPITFVRNKERRAYMNNEQRANIQTNQSFSVLPRKDRGSHQWNKSKGKLRSTAVSTQVKPKLRKSPDLIISEETTVSKVKPKVNSVNGTHRNMDTSAQKKVSELHHAQSKKTNPEKLNKRTQQHPPVRQLKTARQVKRPGVAGAPRSKSAVDFITYKDMFQEIQSGDEGPAIFEMFAGPIYDNLRVSSSCEKQNDRQVQSAPYRRTQHGNKVKPRPTKKQAEGGKLRRSPVQNAMASAKSKQRPASSRDKPRLKPISSTVKTDDMTKLDLQRESELALSKDAEICHDSTQDKCEDYVLSTIEETLSQCESETLKPEDKTTARPTLSSPDDDYCHHTRVTVQGSAVKSSDTKTHTGNPNKSLPEPALSQSSLQPKINTWTSGCSSNHIMSPVYQRFLDDVGEGPLTDDLLQCLAEELISLDEKDESIGPFAEKPESSRGESSKENPVLRRNQFHGVN